MKSDDILKLELKKCFEFFWDFSNSEIGSKGYGLVVDKTSNPNVASIAGCGFALSAYVVGIERGFITREEGYERVYNTLKTLVDNVDHYKGFFAHFVDIKTGKRHKTCEYSTIDTALCLNGVITVESYFRDSKITNLANVLINRVDWDDFVFERNGKLLLKMAYNPDRNGSYREGDDPYICQWDHYAEQQMMYFQYAAKDGVDADIANELYNGFDRNVGTYEGDEFIYTPGGAMFIYQFANGWFPFQKYLDSQGVNWFENSKKAISANRKFCKLQDMYKTLSENVWGLTAGYGPNGYLVSGGPVSTKKVEHMLGDGTVQQYGIASSIIFLPEEVSNSIEHIYNQYPKCFQDYGFTDGMNLEVDWYSDEYLSLDKGITLLMIDNYYDGIIWDVYENSNYIQKAINILGFREDK